MKTLHTLLLTCAFAFTLLAAESEPSAPAGPKGGKIIETAAGRAEFLVRPDRKVSVTFYDAAMKPQSLGAQAVSVVAQTPTGKATLELEKSGEELISSTPLPDGDGYMLIVQVKSGADAKPQNFRIKLDLATCGECKRAEYACACDGHGH